MQENNRFSGGGTTSFDRVGKCRLTHAAVCLLLALALPSFAAEPRQSADTPAEQASRIDLWPRGIAPDDRALKMPQRIRERSADPSRPDRYIEGVSRPYLVVYRPQNPNGTGLLVIPGGGYARSVLDKEGSALVPDFVDAGGVTLFMLRYRLPGEGRADRDASLADAQRALRLIRAHASEWQLDPQRIGAMGFSAGGHLAASLGTRFDERVYVPVDAADSLSARPDFQLLIYPVIDMGSDIAHPGSRERLLGTQADAALARQYSPQYHVTADTPPTFLLHAQDDDVVPVRNSVVMYEALLAAGVAVEMHLFPRGGHGFGTRETTGLAVAAWPALAQEWMHHLDDVEKTK
ncbi:MAG: alpha/beta hydrolase [Pseudoxanthomonas sp.]